MSTVRRTRPSGLQRGLRALVRVYQLLFSHWVNAGCRYQPTCSQYAVEALDRHGGLAGAYLASRRILRCHPFCLGGHDPVPDRPPFGFRRGRTAPPPTILPPP